MKKAELIEVVAASSGENIEIVENVINEVFDVIQNTLKKKETIDIHGFGKFEPRLRKAKICKNPSTGESIESPDKYIPKWKPSTVLKKYINL